jgi:hypothetical protein
MDGVDEVAALDEHHQIDRIEIDFAVKAASEIGPRIGRRQELATLGTEEAESAIANFVGPLESLDERGKGHLVAKLIE